MLMEKTKPIVAKVLARINASRDEKADNPPWIKQVAMLTGVLAAVSGFIAVRATTLTNNAIYESNQAILSQTEASDAWNEYQADSIKSRIMETALTTAEAISPESRAALKSEAAHLRSRQSKIKQTATDKTTERDRHLQTGYKWLAERDLLVYAGLTAQIGIALASVAALVRWLTPFVAGVIVGAVGIGITAYAFAVHYGIAFLYSH